LNPPAKVPINNEAPSATWIHASPAPCAGTVASPALCSPSAEDAGRIAYSSAYTVPREDQIEQRIQKVLPALLPTPRPHNQRALRIWCCCRESLGAFVGPIETVDQRCRQFRVELKVEITHPRFPLLAPSTGVYVSASNSGIQIGGCGICSGRYPTPASPLGAQPIEIQPVRAHTHVGQQDTAYPEVREPWPPIVSLSQMRFAGPISDQHADHDAIGYHTVVTSSSTGTQ
jgi:hypothetical protein